MGDLLKPHGIIALVGGGPEDVAVPRRHLNSKETMVFGSSAYAPIQFEEITEFMRRHDVKLDVGGQPSRTRWRRAPRRSGSRPTPTPAR